MSLCVSLQGHPRKLSPWKILAEEPLGEKSTAFRGGEIADALRVGAPLGSSRPDARWLSASAPQMYYTQRCALAIATLRIYSAASKTRRSNQRLPFAENGRHAYTFKCASTPPRQPQSARP